MSTLERAIALAASAHQGQVDKAGAPYILHPLRVMQKMSNNNERIVAVLHDVVEDCQVTFDQLRSEGFSDEVIDAIDSVTKRKGEDYEQFVTRAAANPIGHAVKLADLRDNMDLSRIPSPSAKDIMRVEKYRLAVETIEYLLAEPFAEFSADCEFLDFDGCVAVREPDYGCWVYDPVKRPISILTIDENGISISRKEAVELWRREHG